MDPVSISFPLSLSLICIAASFDYYGEATHGGFPELSSSFGAFDLAGFAKASAWYFQSWWLNTVDAYNAGEDPEFDRPPLSSGTVVRILNQAGAKGDKVFIVYSNAAEVELWCDGSSLGKRPLSIDFCLEP